MKGFYIKLIHELYTMRACMSFYADFTIMQITLALLNVLKDICVTCIIQLAVHTHTAVTEASSPLSHTTSITRGVFHKIECKVSHSVVVRKVQGCCPRRPWRRRAEHASSALSQKSPATLYPMWKRWAENEHTEYRLHTPHIASLHSPVHLTSNRCRIQYYTNGGYLNKICAPNTVIVRIRRREYSHNTMNIATSCKTPDRIIMDQVKIKSYKTRDRALGVVFSWWHAYWCCLIF